MERNFVYLEKRVNYIIFIAIVGLSTNSPSFGPVILEEAQRIIRKYCEICNFLRHDFGSGSLKLALKGENDRIKRLRRPVPKALSYGIWHIYSTVIQ